jgi:hypothetical protein
MKRILEKIRIERIIAIYLAFLAGWDSYAYYGTGNINSMPSQFMGFVGLAIAIYLVSALILSHLR